MANNKASARSLHSILPWVLPMVVAVVGVVLAYHIIHHIDAMLFKASSENGEEYYSAATLTRCLDQAPANTALTADAIKTCLQSARSKPQALNEIVTPRIDELKWLLTMIAYLGVFYTLAQVGATWFSAEAYTRKAEDGLKKISDALQEINTTYPLFEHVAALRTRSFEALDKVFGAVSRAADSSSGSTEALDWADNLFRKLGVEFRQNLLSAESFASADLDVERMPDEHAELLRKLALFYRSKFFYEASVSQGAFGDLERSEAYLILANKKRRDFTMKNDLGSTYAAIYRAVKKKNPMAGNKDANYYLEQAENAFRESLQIEPNQQRAHYNLAVMAGKYRGQFRGAIEELNQALGCQVWQRGPSDYMQSLIYYNIACYDSRLLQQNRIDKTKLVTRDQGKQVIHFLRRAAELSSVRRELIEEDFNEETGDFTGLLKIAENDLKGELEKLKKELQKRTQEMETTGKAGKPRWRLDRALAKALHAFKDPN